MKKDKLDFFLEESFQQDSDIFPFENNIDNLIGGMFRKRKRARKMLFFIPIVLTSTTVFAIAYGIFNLSSVGIDDSCIEMATKNGYIQKIDEPIQTFDGLGIKIKYFLMDDINLDIAFEYIANNDYVKDIKNVFIKDLYIYDNDNNVIYREENENNKADTIGYSKVAKTSNNTFENTFFGQSSNFPKSKKIYVEFNKVILNCKNENKAINGTWKFEIEVPEIMINRETILYKCISSNNEEDITIDNVKLSNTGLILEASSSNNETLNKAVISVIANNNKYKANNNLFDINIKENIPAKRIQRIYTFNITKYDAPNEIKVIIKNKGNECNMTFIKDEK